MSQKHLTVNVGSKRQGKYAQLQAKAESLDAEFTSFIWALLETGLDALDDKKIFLPHLPSKKDRILARMAKKSASLQKDEELLNKMEG